MRVAKKILLILLAVLLAIQAPFIYRRYKLGRLAAKVEAINNTSRESIAGPNDKFNEYKGIIHAHTSLGGHSTGSFDELIAAANANDLDFVIMTEHWSDTIDTAALTLNGVYGKTLFIGGNEIDTADGDRLLMIPGSSDAAGLRKMPTTAVIDKLHAEGRLAMVTYPEKFKFWDTGFDGVEVFSLHTSAKKMNPFTALFDAIWSFPKYPELMLATYFRRPDENLKKFDEISAKRNISLFAGTDAHSNIGFHLFGDDAGHKVLNFKIDDYQTIFRLARVHVLIEKGQKLDRETLIEALKNGRSFVGFDVLGNTSGFQFEIHNAENVVVSLGGEIFPVTIPNGIDFGVNGHFQLIAKAPVPARFAVFRNGYRLPDQENMVDIAVTEPGAYRVEVYLDQLGPPFDKMPWIISNPIYVR